jgi:hypothetical protein
MAQISLDTTSPMDGAVTATPSDGQVALTGTAATDGMGSGVASYQVVSLTTGVPTLKCTNGTPVYTGTARSTGVAGLVNGTTYNFLVCTLDVAGNVSAGATAASSPHPNLTRPPDDPVDPHAYDKKGSGSTRRCRSSWRT